MAAGDAQFYHDIITEKSFKFLRELVKKYNFVLIGGWAVYLFTRSLKSKDIDIIVDYEELAKLKNNFDVFKNDRLKKYEIETGEFDVDIYLPHYSDLGIKAEAIKRKTISSEGFVLPAAEMLLLLKLYARAARRGTPKGKKDELDIFSLIALPDFNWEKYLEYVNEFSFSRLNDSLRELIKKTRSVVELGINEQRMSKIRKEILGKIGRH